LVQKAEHDVLDRVTIAELAESAGRVLYGGAAGPGTLTALGDAVDGVFLGRFAHDVDALRDVLHEAAAARPAPPAARP
jgi:triosephosphate isomerase